MREVNEEVRAWIEGAIAKFPEERFAAGSEARLSTQSEL